MNERKIIVPEGLLKAGAKEIDCGGSMPANAAVLAGQVLQGALKWLAENPIVPTLADVKEFHSPEMLQLSYHGQLQEACVRWQRRMFLAPTTDDEPIKDLLWTGKGVNNDSRMVVGDEEYIRFLTSNERVIEAYNRGLKQRDQK